MSLLLRIGAVLAVFGIGCSARAATCWVLSDLSGIGYFQGDGYQPQVDRFSKPLTLRLDGNNSRVGDDLSPLKQIDEFMAVGYYKTDSFVTVETYMVDPTLGIALYTKAISAKSVFSNMTGARTFTGQAEPCR